MDTQKINNGKKQAAAPETKKLYLDKHSFAYKIEGEPLLVSVFLDLGFKYQDEAGKERQIPELKMRIERKCAKQSGLSVEQIQAMMRSGFRPISKWCSSFKIGKDGKMKLPPSYKEAVKSLEDDFNHSMVQIFGFQLDASALYGNHLEPIFERAVSGNSLIYSLKEW